VVALPVQGGESVGAGAVALGALSRREGWNWSGRTLGRAEESNQSGREWSGTAVIEPAVAAT
jgi:hypothetical protein